MRSIYESLLDDQDDIINGAEDLEGVKKKAGEGWVTKHGVHNLSHWRASSKIKFGSFEGEFRGIDASTAEYTITKADTDATIPEIVPPIFAVRKFYVKGFLGTEIPDRIVPRQADIVMIVNCPNLLRLPQLPDEVDTFSVSGCPKVVALDGCPQKAKKTFKAVDCGRPFDWKDIHRACPGVSKQNVIY